MPLASISLRHMHVAPDQKSRNCVCVKENVQNQISVFIDGVPELASACQIAPRQCHALRATISRRGMCFSSSRSRRRNLCDLFARGEERVANQSSRLAQNQGLLLLGNHPT